MPEMPEELREALKADESCDLDEIVRRGNRDDFEALLSLLSMDPSVPEEHRARALYALGRWGHPAAVDPIRRLLPHLDLTERLGAIDALGRLARGTETTLDIIEAYAGDESFHVRKFVTRALGRINTPRAQAKLREIESRDSEEYIRSLATRLLSRR